MFKNYFTIALRHLRKQKMYSAIKIGGFALSIAACLLIALYIRDELSYDKSYPDAARIFRVTGMYDDNGKIETGADWPAPMANALKTDFPEVELSGRLMPHELFDGAGTNNIRRTDKEQNTFEQKFSYADQQMLDILKLPMIYGDRAHALTAPKTMVITKSKADKYFPNENPVGKTMILNNDKNRVYTIGGVIRDFAATSHIQYDFLLTMSGNQFWPGEQTTWMASNYYTYVLLRPGTNPGLLQAKLTHLIVTKYYLPALKAQGAKDADIMVTKEHLFLQPISNIHINTAVDDELSHGDIRFVWLFGGVACFILILACINFINLSTAKSANRAKEVGLRKVVGSYRSSLIQQFLTESMLFSVLSFILGILLAWGLLPLFNTLSAKSMTIPWTAWWLLPLMLGAALVVGTLAGLYPAIYLSSFKPIQVLKGQMSRGVKSSLLRNGLVVFQFTTSIILIICTFVIYNQTHYILNAKLGYDKDQMVMIEGTNVLGNEVNNFKDDLLRQPQISAVTISDFLPVSGTKRNGNTFYNEGKEKVESGVFAQSWTVDKDYIPTMGMKIAAGRNFMPDVKSDSQTIIINQTLANKLHLKDPVGKTISNGNNMRIIGVVEDFNFESMRGEIGGLVFRLGNSSSIVSVRLNATQAKQGLAAIASVWKNFAPNQPVRYTFLDESFANMYADVDRMGRIFSSFAVLAIVIAGLGLFALSAFMAEQRNKEIGIRKVLGASIGGITTMLSRDFVKLVVIAIVIAGPIAGWGMTKWLQDFTYRTPIHWWIFGVSALIALLIALVTISFQSIRAAMTNPVQSLRSE
jgi:putative ABC transport system permease protein